jgi:hypothetical protein
MMMKTMKISSPQMMMKMTKVVMTTTTTMKILHVAMTRRVKKTVTPVEMGVIAPGVRVTACAPCSARAQTMSMANLFAEILPARGADVERGRSEA